MFSAAKILFSRFLLQLQQQHTVALLEFVLLELMIEQHAAVKQQQHQAYECCPSRGLLECRWVLPLLLLLLLSVRVPVIAWPRRDCVCIVLVALEQSSDRGLVSFVFAVQ